MNNFFNNNVKSKFLSQFENESTQEVYKRVFKISSELEGEINRDLFNFNEDQLESLIKDHVKPKTKQSARTYCNILSSYIQWSIDNKFSRHVANPLKRRQDYFYKFVSNQNSLYLSKDEIDAILFGLVNAQDKFIIQGIFNGIHGTKMSELTNLTINQVMNAVNNNNKIVLKNDKGEEREIVIDDETIDVALLAYDQKEYYKKNGSIDYVENVKESIELSKSQYILKPTVTNKTSKQVSHYTVYNRLEAIKSLEEYVEYKDALTTKNIIRSGMIYEAKKILDNGGELNRESIERICKKFGMSYKWSLKDFLNEDTVNSVYNN